MTTNIKPQKKGPGTAIPEPWMTVEFFLLAPHRFIRSLAAIDGYRKFPAMIVAAPPLISGDFFARSAQAADAVGLSARNKTHAKILTAWSLSRWNRAADFYAAEGEFFKSRQARNEAKEARRKGRVWGVLFAIESRV